MNKEWAEIFDDLASAPPGAGPGREALDARDSGIHQAIKGELAKILAAQGPRPPAPWLDVGCGTCRVAQDFSLAGYRVVSADLSRKLLARAKREFFVGGLGFVCADVTRLPFREGSLQMVSALGLFSLVDDPRAALREVTRVLAPGGLAVIEFLNRHSLFYHATVWASFLLRRRFVNLRARDHLIRRDTLSELERLAAELSDCQAKARRLFYLPLPGFLAASAWPGRLSALLDRLWPRSSFLSHAFLLVLRKKE